MAQLLPLPMQNHGQTQDEINMSRMLNRRSSEPLCSTVLPAPRARMERLIKTTLPETRVGLRDREQLWTKSVTGYEGPSRVEASTSHYAGSVVVESGRPDEVGRPDELSHLDGQQDAPQESPTSKSNQKLQLPSFASLGIANPHPDHYKLASPTMNSTLQHSSSDGLSSLGHLHRSKLDLERQNLPSLPPPRMLTPPDEHSIHGWIAPGARNVNTITPTLEDTPIAPVETDSHGATSSAHIAASEGSGVTQMPLSTTTDEGISGVQQIPSVTLTPNQEKTLSAADASQGWLDLGLDIALSTIPSSGVHGNAIKALCHALPCPAADGGEIVTSAFPDLVSGLSMRMETSQAHYIQATYALPSQFSLGDLPTSPPVTPIRQMHGGTDYFGNTMVYTNAVSILDRNVLPKNMPAPPSPCPIVPPSSIDFALLERYIPPSEQEYLNIFSPTEHSDLVDRLIELTATGGTLVFIYPTRNGAETFANVHLGPVLDPVIWTASMIHDLSADFCRHVGIMEAVKRMAPFEVMKRKLTTLLRKLNRGDFLAGFDRTTTENKPNYSLVYSSKQEVKLERKAWLKWWTKQEGPRIKQVTDLACKKGTRLSMGLTEAGVVREIIKGVSDRPYPGAVPEDRIEVGVFVIRRSA